ncbi:MAG: hypothetical protein HXY41_18550 [Chloroflexi bacterium]|nr:hypothetical protein [Chloroflexota bacterium]
MSFEQMNGNISAGCEARAWLHRVENHLQVSDWLLRYEQKLFEIIGTELSKPCCFLDAAALLVNVFPFYGLVRSQARRWWPLLMDALNDAQTLRDSEIQILLLTQLGESYAMSGKPSAARTAFELAAWRAGERRLTEMWLAAYIGMVRLQTFYLNKNYDPELLNKVANLMTETQDALLIGMAQQTLATAYVFIEEWTLALEYSQAAFLYWLRVGETLYLAQTAFLIAVIYRKMRRFALAKQFFQLSRNASANTGYVRHNGLSAYEQGVLSLEQQDYAAARNWFQSAYGAFKNLEGPYDIAMSHHSLGLAETGLGLLESARENLIIGASYWEQLENDYELANAYQALAYLEGRAGNIEAGLKWLEKADKVWGRVPSFITKRERLRKAIDDTRNELLESPPGPH